MTENDPASSVPSAEELAPLPGPELEAAQFADDPGYVTESGQAVGEDGSIAPIIGGLPAVEGSAWDIGAPADERGAGLAETLGSPPGPASDDTN